MLGTTEGPDDKAAKSPDARTAEGSDDEVAGDLMIEQLFEQ